MRTVRPPGSPPRCESASTAAPEQGRAHPAAGDASFRDMHATTRSTCPPPGDRGRGPRGSRGPRPTRERGVMTMSTVSGRSAPASRDVEQYYAGAGWVLFATIMLFVSAALNAIWGIAAISKSRFFVGDASYIFSDLKTWGWIIVGFALLETLAALSVARGGAFGRWFGIAAAALGILAAMLSSPGYPLWSLVLVAI